MNVFAIPYGRLYVALLKKCFLSGVRIGLAAIILIIGYRPGPHFRGGEWRGEEGRKG